jgi:DNA mismatch endonuclease (patch repair protein)
MTDVFSKKQRSKNMAQIRSKGNKTTEAEFVRQLRSHKIIGWRRHLKGAYGSPDFLFKKSKLAVFVDGCFWHGCKKHCIMPKSNTVYWIPKIARNIARDKTVNSYYRANGWKIIRIWEHEIKKTPLKSIKKIEKALK